MYSLGHVETKEGMFKTFTSALYKRKVFFSALTHGRHKGSISVSEQLPTYPSPNPTLTLTCYQLTVVELGEG